MIVENVIMFLMLQLYHGHKYLKLQQKFEYSTIYSTYKIIKNIQRNTSTKLHMSFVFRRPNVNVHTARFQTQHFFSSAYSCEEARNFLIPRVTLINFLN